MTTYRLTSADFVYAPGFIKFVINGAKFKKDRQQMIELVVKGWHIPHHAADALVCGKVPYKVERDAVVFTVETMQ